MAALGLDDDLDLVRRARPLLQGQPKFVSAASLPVLGELTVKLLGQWDSDSQSVLYEAIDQLNRHQLRGRLEIFALGPVDEPASRLAAQMQKEDGRMSPTDALVVACMLVDEKAEVLLTTDSFVASRVVQDAAREHGKQVRELG